MTISYKLREIPAFDGLRHGLNSTGSTIATALVVTGGEDAITIPTGLTDPISGVTRAAIADGTRGPLGYRGRFIATAGSGGVTAEARCMIEVNTGKLIPWAPSSGANATIVGIAKTAAAANGQFEIEINDGASLAQGA